MNQKEHRIYQYLSEPLTILGMTVDEIVLGMTGIGGCLFVDSLVLKSLFALFEIGGVMVVKRVKKLVSGFSLGSFLHWYFGIMPGRSFAWPESWKRFWLS